MLFKCVAKLGVFPLINPPKNQQYYHPYGSQKKTKPYKIKNVEIEKPDAIRELLLCPDRKITFFSCKKRCIKPK